MDHPPIFKTSRSSGKIVSDILPPQRKGEPKGPDRVKIQETAALKPKARPSLKPEPPASDLLGKSFHFLRGRPKRKTEATPEIGLKDVGDLSTEINLPIRTWEPEVIKHQRRLATVVSFGSLIIVMAGFILPLAALPKFTVTITPKVESVLLTPLTLEALTSTAAPNAEKRQIPAVRLGVLAEVSVDQKATESKHLAERASGTINIFNAYSSSPQTLVSGTRFRAPNGQIFRLNKSIVIPGAKIEEGKIVPQSITAQVSASDTGEAYNIGPTDFRIPGFLGSPKYDDFYAKSQESMQGGFEGEAIVASADDIRKGEEEATRRLIKNLEEKLAAKIPSDPDLLVINGARQTAVTNIERPQVGRRGESFAVTAKGRGELMLIRRSHLYELIRIIALSEESTIRLTPLQPKLEMTSSSFDVEASRMSLRISGSVSIFRKTPAEEVSKVLKSSTPTKAGAYLRGQEEIASFRVKKFPAWLWFIPRREGGLKVVVEEPQG